MAFLRWVKAKYNKETNKQINKLILVAEYHAGAHEKTPSTLGVDL
jgi:hypothetical protein